MFQFRSFPTYTYFIQCTLHGYCPCGLPHSEICGSMDICSSPQLIAACHVLRRLLMPRHSPCALISLTNRKQDILSFSLWIMQASQIVFFEIVIVTLHLFRCFSTIKITCFPCFSAQKPLCCLTSLSFCYIVQFSRCSFPISFDIRSQNSIS